MEEDIKIIKKFIVDIRACGLGDCSCNKEIPIKSIENLIKGYRELEEENQKLIYELQDKDDEIRFANRDIKVFETDFIPKSKIKEKIEELENNLKDFEETDNTGRFKREKSRDYDKLLVLQELIED